MSLSKRLVGVIKESRKGYEQYLRVAGNFYQLFPEEPIVELKTEDEYIADRIIEFLEKNKLRKKKSKKRKYPLDRQNKIK
jgi:hypothetical protein